MLLKALVIKDLYIRVSTLPNLAAKPEFLVGAKEKLPLINCIAFSILISLGTVIRIWT